MSIIKDEIIKIDKELHKTLMTIIHDWRNYRVMMNIYSDNENNESYVGEFKWDRAKEYWDEKNIKLNDKINELENILYKRLN